MAERINYNYHIFGLIRGNRKNIEKYVADGPSNELDEPTVMSKISHLATEVCTNHTEYLRDHVDHDLLSNRIRYIGFSFEPPCDNIIYEGNIYRTQRLPENEQRSFMGHIKKCINHSASNLK